MLKLDKFFEDTAAATATSSLLIHCPGFKFTWHQNIGFNLVELLGFYFNNNK